MDVRMVAEVASPGLEHSHYTEVSSQVLVLESDVLQSGGTLAQQQWIKRPLV